MVSQALAISRNCVQRHISVVQKKVFRKQTDVNTTTVIVRLFGIIVVRRCADALDFGLDRYKSQVMTAQP